MARNGRGHTTSMHNVLVCNHAALCMAFLGFGNCLNLSIMTLLFDIYYKWTMYTSRWIWCCMVYTPCMAHPSAVIVAYWTRLYSARSIFICTQWYSNIQEIVTYTCMSCVEAFAIRIKIKTKLSKPFWEPIKGASELIYRCPQAMYICGCVSVNMESVQCNLDLIKLHTLKYAW